MGQVRLNADDDVEVQTWAHTTNSHRLGFFETAPVPQHVARDDATAPCDAFSFCGDLPGRSNDHELGDTRLSNALETVQNVAFAWFHWAGSALVLGKLCASLTGIGMEGVNILNQRCL